MPPPTLEILDNSSTPIPKHFTTPHSKLRIPNYDLPTPHSVLRIPNYDLPTPH
jgi:hypothetical protein